MESNGGFAVEDIIGMLKRRWLLLVAPLFVGVPLAAAVAVLLPATYTSTARIIVESQQVPDSLARSTVAQSSAERIQLIRQRLLTRNNLLNIASDVGVFADRTSMSPTDIVEEMRRATRIEGISLGGRSGSVAGVEITFHARNPQSAARVVNEFVSRMLAQNVEQRTARATGTLTFFNREVERLAAELDQQAQRITDFKNENQDSLPDSLGSRQSELSMMRDRMFTRSTQRAGLEERRMAMVRSIEQGATGMLDADRRSPEMQELSRLRSSLVVQRATLSDSHPTVRLLNARIAALESAVGRDMGVINDGTPGSSLLEQQLAVIDREIALIDERDASDEARIEALEESIRRTPGVEMQLAGLERQYSNLQVQYREAVLKRSQAEMGERLEANQQAERFEVIEQAIAAPNPVSPNRPLIVAGGVVGSLGLGVGLMILMELLNRAIYSVRDMERRLDLRPIVTIPYIRSSQERTVRVWLPRAILAMLAIGLPLALFLIDRFYLPLPLVFDRIANTTGLNVLIDAITERTR